MAKREDTKGPYIRWLNYGYEGWKPTSYDKLEEALGDINYGNDYIVTKPVKFTINEIETDA